MPPAKRPSLRDRLPAGSAPPPEPRGREAVYTATSSPVPTPRNTSAHTVDDRPWTVDRRPSTVDVERWEDTHQRVTFYCPRELLAVVEAEMERSGRSKSRVIVDALAEHLRPHSSG